MGIIIGGVSPQDLIMDGQSVSLYVGGNPPTKVWPTRETVQITLGTGTEASDQLRAALTARGLYYQTVTEIPFEIELVGTGSAQYLFADWYALTTAPAMDTSQVTDMAFMFRNCSLLTSVPDMDTSQVTEMRWMLFSCSSLTDGNVRLIGRHPNVDTTGMIRNSGLTYEPFYTADGAIEVSVTNVWGHNTAHPLVTVTVPAGETWNVRVQGTVTKADSGRTNQPLIRIGATTFGPYAQGASVDVSGTVTSADSTIAFQTVINASLAAASFVGTVTIEK